MTSIPTPKEVRERSRREFDLVARVMHVMLGDKEAPEGTAARKPQPPTAHPSGLLCYNVSVGGAGVDLTELRAALGDAWTAEIIVLPDRRTFVRVLENDPDVLGAWEMRVKAIDDREHALRRSVAEFGTQLNELKGVCTRGAKEIVEAVKPFREKLGKDAADLLEAARSIDALLRAHGEQTAGIIRASQMSAQTLSAAITDVRAVRASLGADA